MISIDLYRSGGSLLGSQPSGGVDSGLFTPLFEDDFSSGDTAKHNDYFRWGREGTIPVAGANSSRIQDVMGPDGETVKALIYNYGTWQENRFHLTESVNDIRSENTLSDTYYDEVWMSYDLFVPANYVHQSSGDDFAGGGNNKGFFYLWQGTYEGSQTQCSTSIQWWPSTQRTTDTGVSQLSLQTLGHTHNPDYVTPEHTLTGNTGHSGQVFAAAIIPDDYGTWVNMAFRIYAGSTEGASDGVVEVYKNGQLIIRFDNYDSVRGNNGRPLGYDRGYLWGYHNSGYPELTTFYLTNFKFGGIN